MCVGGGGEWKSIGSCLGQPDLPPEDSVSREDGRGKRS